METLFHMFLLLAGFTAGLWWANQTVRKAVRKAMRVGV